MSRRFFFLLLLAGANAALAVAAWTRQPWANGPEGWRWEYLRPGGLAAGGRAGAVLALSLAGLGLLWGHRRLAAWRAAPLAAVTLGAAFTYTLVAAQPGDWSRVAEALVSRNGFGYVWDAALAPPARALLADYPAAGAGLNQHSLTHPPGALLAVRALGGLDRLLPAPAVAGTVDGGTGSRPLSELAAAAIRREMQRARAHGRPLPQAPPGPWQVTALALLLPALSALAAWPLFLLARRWAWERQAALLAAVLWLLTPARSLFTPSLDQALPALLAGAACLAADGRRVRSAAAGALLFAACFLSYGCLAALPLVVACAAAASPARQGSGYEPGAAAAAAPDRWRWAALALGFALPYLLLAIATGHDPWHALRTALELHHRIAVAPRPYLTWLLWNPYDFMLLLSPAVLGLAAWALRRRAPWRLPVLAWWGTLALLLLSGGVRGEVGRIWLMWMPFACLFAAGAAAGGDVAPAGHEPGAGDHGPQTAGPQTAHRTPGTAGSAGENVRAGIGLVLATEAALTLSLAATMVFVS
jgi:hypothetical protein